MMKDDGKVINRAILQYLDSRGGKSEYFITKNQIFPSIAAMIEFFSKPFFLRFLRQLRFVFLFRHEKNSLRDHSIPCVLKQWPPKKTPPRIEMSLDAQRKWRGIPRLQIILGEINGDGHFGVVYEGEYQTDWRPDLMLAFMRLAFQLRGKPRTERIYQSP